MLKKLLKLKLASFVQQLLHTQKLRKKKIEIVVDF
nr:MAG TPA: hypothetical protein [Caudoviricetes sp.]